MALARCPEAAGAATNERGVVSVRRVGDGTVSRARTAAATTAALVSERRCDSLNPNGMDAAFLSRLVAVSGAGKTKGSRRRLYGRFAGGPADLATSRRCNSITHRFPISA